MRVDSEVEARKGGRNGLTDVVGELQMRTSADPKADLERTFRLMDVADEIRRQHRRVTEHLESSDREKIKAELIERYRGMGHEADPALIDEAIGLVLEQRYRFEPPRRGFGLGLARLWVQRRKVARNVGIPTVVLAVLAGGIWVASTGLTRVQSGNAERRVEQSVTELFSKAQSQRAEAEGLTAQLVRDAVPAEAGTAVARLLSQVDPTLDEVERFLADYAPDGDPAPKVTRSNYKRVRAELGGLQSKLEESRLALEECQQLIGAESDLTEITLELNRLYLEVKGLAREPSVLERTEEIYMQAQSRLVAKDLERARALVAELAELDATLEREYTLIVLRGRERDETRYYLIVQAIDSGQRPIRVRIRDEETNRFEEVLEWGERVSKSEYDRIAKDYAEDNVIDDRIFGRKRRGYLEPERGYPDLGQITRY